MPQGHERRVAGGRDAVVRIPTGGVVSSLNAACAATVVRYEAAGQHGD